MGCMALLVKLRWHCCAGNRRELRSAVDDIREHDMMDVEF